MADEDPHYTRWIRKQPCCYCLGPGPCHNHHHTAGSTVAPGEKPKPKQFGGKRGKGQRAHDHFSMPMHVHCHARFHAGIVETGDDRRAWQDEQVRIHRERYEAETLSGVVAASEIKAPPAALGFVDEARKLCAHYELSRQIELDIVRLVRRAAGDTR